MEGYIAVVTDPLEREAALVVLRAIAQNQELKKSLFLKGAHATEAYTQRPRSTKDIDFTMVEQPCPPSNKASADNFKKLFNSTLQDYLDISEQNWTLRGISAHKKMPNRDHPMGWDGFEVKITLVYKGGKTTYTVKLDISPEDPPISTVKFDCETGTIVSNSDEASITLLSYSAAEIVAEKLRAFLQRLPPYRKKHNSNLRPPRVRDIRDIFMMVDVLGKELDLEEVAETFKRKCKSKYVDCTTPADFYPESNSIGVFKQAYENDGDLNPVTFDDAWRTMIGLVEQIDIQYGLPGKFPIE
jgi:hypothetical protein